MTGESLLCSDESKILFEQLHVIAVQGLSSLLHCSSVRVSSIQNNGSSDGKSIGLLIYVSELFLNRFSLH